MLFCTPFLNREGDSVSWNNGMFKPTHALKTPEYYHFLRPHSELKIQSSELFRVPFGMVTVHWSQRLMVFKFAGVYSEFKIKSDHAKCLRLIMVIGETSCSFFSTLITIWNNKQAAKQLSYFTIRVSRSTRDIMQIFPQLSKFISLGGYSWTGIILDIL
jgi:hypothetical protein